MVLVQKEVPLGLAVVSLLVLVILGTLGGLVLARVFAAAASRNENRPGGGDEDERDLLSPDEPARKERKRMIRTLGRALAAFGVLLAVAGTLSAFSELSLNSVVPATFVGAVLGVTAYRFGARNIGAVAAVFSVLALIFGVAVSQGLLPGVERTDRTLPAYEPDAQRPSGVDTRTDDAQGN